MFHPDGPTFLELLRQGLSSTDAGYDLLAPKFEHTPFRTPDILLEASARFVGAPVDRGLDLCCGTGAGMAAFRPLCRTQIAGVDRSAGMLVEARKRLSAGSGAPFALVRGDALALPFARCFDLVTCFGAFGHILEADEPRLVAEVARVLRPGGRFLFITADEPPLLHPGRLFALGFNAAMRLRNALLEPKFVMYYLTFLLPRAQALLTQAGFTVEAPQNVLPAPFQRLRLVCATVGTKRMG
jgi:ubiquinone/menaquinone biosynthesis C-methylase UbiE